MTLTISGETRKHGARPPVLPPEWLDSLPANAPEARASRRDLERFNSLLGVEQWVSALIQTELRRGERVLEIGAGDGHLARKMLARGIPWDGLDLTEAPANWPENARWFRGDALNFSYTEDHAVVVANLLLHHFTDAQLAELGRRVRETARVIVISDLQRSEWRVRIFAVLCALMGAHAVSRHDGALSIRAGFRGEELPAALGLTSNAWRWKITQTIVGAHRLVAVRKP